MFKLINLILIVSLFSAGSFINQSKSEELLRSHEATYSLKLSNVTEAGKIHSVNGEMFIDIREVCDGWLFHQHTTLDVTDRMGNQNRSEFKYSTWESFDHKKFRFLSRSMFDGRETSFVEGHAYIGKDEGKVIFNMPEIEELKISSKTMFPINHFFMTFKEQPKNNTLSNEIVFTGENEDSLSLVSTFTSYITNGDGKEKFVKIRSAYFPLSDLSEQPENEIELIVDSSGLVKSVIFDYIDYEIKGSLINHKYISKTKC